MPDPTFSIRPAQGPDDIEAVRRLCWAYRRALSESSEIDAQITETFYPEPVYSALMDRLEEVHAPPRGIILLAERDGRTVGCGMTQPLDPETAEVKRVFVAPEARGIGVARGIMQGLMDHARLDGFSRVLLDTSVTLAPARALYASLGFRERGPYQDIPARVLPHLVFFESPL